MAQYESYKNGLIFGMAFGVAILWGNYIKDPILNFLNGIIPTNYQFGGISAIAAVILVGAIIGYLIDRT